MIIPGEVFTHCGDIYMLTETRDVKKVGIITAYIFLFKRWLKSRRENINR